MAWTDPTTRSTGDLITAAIWNTDMVDNFTYLRSGLPMAHVYHDANQTYTASTPLTLAFNSERYDTDAIHDTSTNNSRLTCKTAGKYHIWATIEWDVQTGGSSIRSIIIKLGGATVIGKVTVFDTPTAGLVEHVSCDYELAVNNYVEVIADADNGTGLEIVASANYSPAFGMHRIG
jgi:hypothetical protein